jgi:hypothetical protein
MRHVVSTFAVLILTFEASAATAPSVDFVREPNRIDVTADGRLFASYVYGDNLPKPSLVPVRSVSGIEVTRRWPLTKLEGGSMDHLHHVGLFFCVDRVNDTNFWNYYRNPGGREPKIRHVRFEETAGGPGRGVLRAVSHWIDKKGNLLLEEKRSMTFIAGEHEGEYAIDFGIDLTAQAEQVVFEDIEEGVLGVRLSDYLRESDREGGVRPGRTLPAESVAGTGRYFSSNGDQTAENVWGKRARWVALQGVKGGKVVGLAILNHPESINYPTYWHVRDYGLFAANPLGQGDFQRQGKYKKNPVIPLRLTLKPGQTAHFRFFVIVFEGVRTQKEIEERFRAFVE